MRRYWLLLLLALPACAEFRAGAARVNINPDLPAWLTGFAARTRPADRIAQDIQAKALAIDDGTGGRLVLVTADLIGFTREVTDEVAARVARKHGLERRQVLFNASHTHSGPSIWPRLHVAPAFSPEIDQQVRAYTDKLIPKLEDVIGRALANLRPATADFSTGDAAFAMNRRVEHLARIRPGETFPAPIDHSVPVLRLRANDGSVLAIVFGYACHNTVLTAEFAEVSGDYAGFAQASLERTYPGATALFVTLCAGDQRANPRSRRELAQQHGEELAEAVRKALSAPTQTVTGTVRTAYTVVDLPFQMHSREVYDGEAKSGDMFLARRGRLMRDAMDAKTIPHSTPYPAQSFRLGNGPAWVALGGEVVIDYQLRLKQEYGANRVVVAGYSNDVMGYIPSRRVQREGGYEAGDALLYFSQPGWFTEQVEDLVVGAARRVLGQVGLQP